MNRQKPLPVGHQYWISRYFFRIFYGEVLLQQ